MTGLAWDAVMECRHERIPFDPCPSPDGKWPHPWPCNCSPVEAGVSLTLVPEKPVTTCLCGCGLPTKRADRDRGGVRKGEPLRYVHGHNFRQAA